MAREIVGAAGPLTIDDLIRAKKHIDDGYKLQAENMAAIEKFNDMMRKHFINLRKEFHVEQPKELQMTDLPADFEETAKAIEEQKAKLEQAEAERVRRIKEADAIMDKAVDVAPGEAESGT